MRFLAMHVDQFRSEITEKGRSKLIEPADPRVTEVFDALVVLSSVEKGDEPAPDSVAAAAAAEIADLASRLGVKAVVLHPFAHLFAELASPPLAVRVLDSIAERLRGTGHDVTRTPFGWFNTLELKAKGHPLSRVARTVTAGRDEVPG